MTSIDKLPSAKQSITRDRWGRPLVIPPDGGKPVAYRRVTTIAKAIDDTSNLQRWAQRMTAFGLAKRPDLFALVARCELDDKKELDRLCDQAKEHAGGSAAANTGTAIHALLEQYDNGQDPTPVNANEQLALEAWQRFLTNCGWSVDGVEVFVVQDDIKAAGTLDRILSGHIADLKTGASADYGHQAWSAQLAIYAGSKRYVDGVRTPLNVDRTTGFILHLPVGAKDVTVYDIDLVRGREIAKVAMSVIEWRATRDLMRRHNPWDVLSKPVGAKKTRKSKVADGTPSELGRADIPDAGADIAPEGREAGQSSADPLGSPSEGGLYPDMAAALLARLKALPDLQRAVAYKWAREARDAGLWQPLAENPSRRRCEIARAMIAWAPRGDDALRAQGPFGDVPTGVVLARLPPEAAKALADEAMR